MDNNDNKPRHAQLCPVLSDPAVQYYPLPNTPKRKPFPLFINHFLQRRDTPELNTTINNIHHLNIIRCVGFLARRLTETLIDQTMALVPTAKNSLLKVDFFV